MVDEGELQIGRRTKMTEDNSKKKVWGDLNKAEKAEALRASLEKKMAQEDNCSEDQAKKFLDSKVEIIIL